MNRPSFDEYFMKMAILATDYSAQSKTGRVVRKAIYIFTYHLMIKI